MSEGNYDPAVYAAMQTGKPYKTYKKTIYGQVFVNVLNSFNKQPEGIILKGAKNVEGEFLDVWNEMEDVYFKRMNRRHFETGRIIEQSRPVATVPVEKPLESYNDNELKTLLTGKYYVVKYAVLKIISPVVLQRLHALAVEMDKPKSLIDIIEDKLAKIEAEKYEIPKEE